MKKLFIYIMLFLCLFFLIGCGNKDNNIDGNNTDQTEEEKNEYGIEATDDKTKIVDALMAIIEENEGHISDSSNSGIIDCEIDLSQIGEEEVSVKANCSIDFVFETNEMTETMALENVLNAIEASAKISFSGKVSLGSSELIINESHLNFYLENGKAYCKINVDENLFDMIGEDYSAINNNIVTLDFASLLPLLPIDNISEYMSIISLENSESIFDLLNINKDELRSTIEELVEIYKISIKEVKGNKVTFVMDLTDVAFKDNVDSSFKIEYVIDVKEGIELESALIDCDVNLSMVKGKFKVNIKNNGNATVEKLNDEDKAKAFDISTLIIPEEDDFGVFASTAQMIEFASKNVKTLKTYLDSSLNNELNFTVPSGGYDGSEVTITFYHTMGSNLTDVLNVYIEEFNKIYPNIHINHSQIGGYNDVKNQIKTEMLVGGQPNIAYCYQDHVAFYNENDAVVHLDDLIASTESDGNGGKIGLTSEQKNNFIDAFYNEGMQFGDGHMYTMPFSKSTEVLYYNKTFFENNNIQVPDHWFTQSADDVTSMEYVCKRIKSIDPNSIPLGYDSESNWFITMCEQMGSGYTDAKGNILYNNAYTKGFLKEFNKWYQTGLLTTQTVYGSYTSSLFTNTDPDRQKCYMCIASSSGATHERPAKENGFYPFEVGIASIPQMCEGNPNVITQGPSICIFKKDNPQEVIASWLFIKYLTTSIDFQVEFSISSGYMPVIKNASQSSIFSNALALANGYDYIQLLSLKYCLEHTNMFFTIPGLTSSDDVKANVRELMTKSLSYWDVTDIKGYIGRLLEGIPFYQLPIYGVDDDGGMNIDIPLDRLIDYSGFMSAEFGTEVVVKTFIQAKTKWYEEGYTSIYAMNENCGYYIYKVQCTKEQYDNLDIGECIIVKGNKQQWSGLIEITEATIYEIDSSYRFVAKAGTLMPYEFEGYSRDYINQLIALHELKVLSFSEDEDVAFRYKYNGTGERGDDIYFKVQVGNSEYIFVVAAELCDENSEVYKMAESLKVGDIIDIEGFVYWYHGPQPHVTKIIKK